MLGISKTGEYGCKRVDTEFNFEAIAGFYGRFFQQELDY